MSEPRFERRQALQTALLAFTQQPLKTAAIALFNTLGYHSDKTADFGNSAEEFLTCIEQQAPNYPPFNRAQLAADQWLSCAFLFQLTDDDIPLLAASPNLFNHAPQLLPNQIESFVFLAVDLSGETWSRTQFASITRELNRRFPMPAIVLFRHGQLLSLAVIDRRVHLRDSSRDVIHSRITVIKDVCCSAPHRAHLDILSELTFSTLIGERKQRPTNFRDLYDAWIAVLSTQELNKNFYRELANWYFWAIQTVKFPTGSNDSEDVRNATGVIRLITRLIFIWFIKERGLVSNKLFDLQELNAILKVSPLQAPEASHYYQAILQNLFFATLNTSMGEKRRFRGKNKVGGQDSHFCIHNIYRYEHLFHSTDEVLELFKDVPFLNGGLFECLDKPEKINGRNTCVRIDGFSDRDDNALHVPNKLFFADEFIVDLNEVFATRNKVYRTRGLIHILNSYKFTVDENTPVEEEVALDPELLGKVFENLLASYNPETSTTARKQTGSFYTPREIVAYMVDEALLIYLAKVLEPAETTYSVELRNKLLLLLSYSEQTPNFSDTETKALIAAIDRIKVLDPTCGSGAFPMGMLLKLVHVLSKLDPRNQEWKSRQVARVNQLMRDAEAIEDGDFREKVLAELRNQRDDIENAFERNELDYGRKLFIIENCIYGVDIQPIAVQIAKLRFFISLIVNETIDAERPNRGIRPLPNLETKFVAANSLIAIKAPDQAGISAYKNDIDAIKAELKRVRKRHFNARTQAAKENCRTDDKNARAQLGALLLKDGFQPDLAQKLMEWNPYDQSLAAAFFDPAWMFDVRDGFDIVIGNPPYLRVQGLQQTQPDFIPLYRERFKQSAKGNFDLYVLFIEHGFELLNTQGQLAYIVPHKFFQAKFGVGLRTFLTERQALREIVRFGAQQVFDEATTYTCLLFLSAQPQMNFHLLEVRSLENSDEVLRAVNYRSQHPDLAYGQLPAPINNDWDFTLGAASDVLQRLQQHPRTLGEITRKIFVGLQTSADKIYVLKLLEEDGDILRCYSKQLDVEIEIERGLTRPFLMGKDVHRYQPARPKNVVIFPYWINERQARLMTQTEIKQQFPLGWTYLETNRHALGERERGRMHGEQFYAYIYPKNLVEFDSVKLMTPDICARPELTLDASGDLYHTTTLYSLAFKTDIKESPRYFLGLLNSTIIWYFIKATGNTLRGDYYRFKTEYLRPFPIPDSTLKQQQHIETLVDVVLNLKRDIADKHADKFEQLINALVYELYFAADVHNANIQLFAACEAAQITQLAAMDNAAILKYADCIFAADHAIAKLLVAVQNLPVVQLIEGEK